VRANSLQSGRFTCMRRLVDRIEQP
jgi:hypothetical protein